MRGPKNHEVRERCPECRGLVTFSPLRQKWSCRYCKTLFKVPVIGTKYETTEKKVGAVAGKIVIGRGSVWNAGLV